MDAASRLREILAGMTRQERFKMMCMSGIPKIIETEMLDIGLDEFHAILVAMNTRDRIGIAIRENPTVAKEILKEIDQEEALVKQFTDLAKSPDTRSGHWRYAADSEDR
jgi:hypothetical protein